MQITRLPSLVSFDPRTYVEIGTRTMAAADKVHLHEEELSDGARKAAEDSCDFVRNAPYRPIGHYEICSDVEGVNRVTRPFLKAFASSIKV